MRKLTAKRKKFVDEYLKCLVATTAAIRAGYSKKTAKVTGAQLLTFPNVQEAIEKAQANRSKRTNITQDMVLKELANIAFGNLNRVSSWGADGVDLKESSDLSEDDAATVSEVAQTATPNGTNVKIKQHDKVKALQLLGQHLGMFANINLNADMTHEDWIKQLEDKGNDE
jgi:phage terminase small subunit